MLITAIKGHQAELVEELVERQQEAERRALEMFKELQQEIHDLQTRGSEVQGLERSQNPVHLLQVNYLTCILTVLC